MILQRCLDRIGRYVDDLLFGEDEHREVNWALWVFVIVVLAYLAWEISR